MPKEDFDNLMNTDDMLSFERNIMGVSHLIYGPENDNEGLMVDIDEYDNNLSFEISLGRWSTGDNSFGFNAAISGLTFEQFDEIVEKLVKLRNAAKSPLY